MAHTETMPQSRISLDGHGKLLHELVNLPQDELELRSQEVGNYLDAGKERDIVGWQMRAGRLLAHLEFEVNARLNDRAFTPEEIAEAVERLGL